MSRRAIVLAGGMGTRLRPYTFVVPKPLIPIGDKPIVELLLERLAAQGFGEVYLALGYHAELIQAYLGDGGRLGLRLFYCRESKRLGTAGPVRMVCDQFQITDPVLVMNADILTRLEFAEMFQQHLRSEAALTIGVRQFRETIPFGRVEMSPDGTITGVEEKPTFSFSVSAGIYVLGPESVHSIPPGAYFDMPDLAMTLIRERKRVVGFEITQPWSAIEDADDWKRVMAERGERDETSHRG